MTPIEFPLPGQFVRPVGNLRYCYCLEVVRVHAPDQDDDASHWTMRRWGLSDAQQPCIDEGPRGDKALRYYRDLRRVAPGLWRDYCRSSWVDGPMYYRQIEVGGQMELFS